MLQVFCKLLLFLLQYYIANHIPFICLYYKYYTLLSYLLNAGCAVLPLIGVAEHSVHISFTIGKHALPPVD